MKKIAISLALAALLTCGAGRLRAAAPNIQIVRQQYYEQLGALESKLVAELPPDAFTTDAQGRRVAKPDHPKYVEAKAKFKAEAGKLRDSLRGMDSRLEEFGGVLNEAGVKNFEMPNTGGAPKNVTSDMDFTARDGQAFDKLKGTLQGKKGITVQVHDDRLYVPEWDCTVWAPANKEAIGSAAHQAAKAKTAQASDTFSTSGGLNKTSGGKLGAADKPGEVLANANKFAEAQGKVDEVESAISSGNQVEARQKMSEVAHTTGKSTDKAAEWSGTKGGEPELETQLDGIRKGQTLEETDIVNLGDPPEVKLEKLRTNLGKQRKSLARSYKAATVANEPVLKAQQEEIAQLEVQGRKQTAVQKRAEVIDSQVSNIETVNEIAARDPELIGEMAGVPVKKVGGRVVSPTTGESVSISKVKEGLLGQLKEQFLAAIRAPKSTTPPVDPMVPGGRIKVFGKVVVTGLGLAMAGLSLYDAVEAAAQRAVTEEHAGDFAGKTYLKTAAYAVWELSGIPGAVTVGQQQSDEAIKQYLADLKAGKDPSKAWVVLHSGYMGGKEMLYQATIGGILETVNRGLMKLNGESKYIARQEDEIKRMQEKLQEMMIRKAVLAHAIGRMSKIDARISPEKIDPADPVQKHYFTVNLKNVPTWHTGSNLTWLFSDGTPGETIVPQVTDGNARIVIDHVFRQTGPQSVRADVVIDGPEKVQYSITLTAAVNVRAETRIALPERVLLADKPGTIALQCNVVNGPKGWRVRWDFGDGSMPEFTDGVSRTQHNFARPGKYTLQVTLLDAAGKALGSDRNSIEIGADKPPAAGTAHTSKIYTVKILRSNGNGAGLNVTKTEVGSFSYYMIRKDAIAGQLKENLKLANPTSDHWDDPGPPGCEVDKWPHIEELGDQRSKYALILHGPLVDRETGIKANFDHGVLQGEWKKYQQGAYGNESKLIISGSFMHGLMDGRWKLDEKTEYVYSNGWITQFTSEKPIYNKGAWTGKRQMVTETYRPPEGKKPPVILAPNSYSPDWPICTNRGEVLTSTTEKKP